MAADPDDTSLNPLTTKKPIKNSRLHFLSNISPEYIENLRLQYQDDPQSVSPDWALFFDGMELASNAPQVAASSVDNELVLEMRVKDLIDAYRMRGHLSAKIDPLDLWQPPIKPHLDLSYFNLDKIDPHRPFQAATELGLPPSTVPKIVDYLKNTYSKSIGVEYHYIRDEKVTTWLKSQIEKNANQTNFTKDQKLHILRNLYRGRIFEAYLQTSYTGQKRFSLEGGESLIPALNEAILSSADLGAKEIVMGMAHRGRLNVLANVMNKPYEEIFKEFEGAELPAIEETSGDVKYHMGYSADIKGNEGQDIHLSLAPNPSHLEFVAPVVHGVVRAKQESKYKSNYKSVVPLVIHGDAAIIGQGVTSETFNLQSLEGYKTGGTIHVVINNQIGFTTLPEESRSSLYCTDGGKAFQSPIFHVNGDDPEAVVHVMRMAVEYRMKFHRDVFVDIWCYRKYGHNEGDEPRFTQPMMYDVIRDHPSPLDIYVQKLARENIVDQTIVDEFIQEFKEDLDQRREKIKTGRQVLQADMFRGQWEGLQIATRMDVLKPCQKLIEEKHLDRIIKLIHEVPESVRVLPKFKSMLEKRHEKFLQSGEADWAIGEQIAFGSLLLEGHTVRLSGQDSVRGTFSHRHSAFTDQITSARYYPLRSLASDQASFEVYDSPLSEAAVLGFDYGYSLARPNALTLWEAQFGDFANGAQVIIDQFVTSAESKWYRMSGLVLLLPHGYEGQGPEHSSARLERFLQLCAGNNIQVAYPTTPAQYCHLLRSQIHRNFRKPLVVMTPKSPLRMPEVISHRDDFLKNGFQNLLIDSPPSDKPEKVILCTGKIYWDLLKAATDTNILDRLAIVRLEKIYPLDKEALQEIRDRWKDIPWVWAQEEPKNMGAWSFMRLNLLDLGLAENLSYAGRHFSASPATGSPKVHRQEQAELINDAIKL